MSAADPQALIRVSLVVPAGRAAVWEAWTDARLAGQWWGGWPVGEAPPMTFEAKVGGSWRFAMKLEGGVQWVGGRVTQLDAPGLLGLTFAWEGAGDPATPVKIALVEEAPDRTRVELVHDQSLGGNACAEGWGWSLGCLRGWLETQL